MTKDFIKLVQWKVAISAVGISTVRKQGKGILKDIHEFLSELDLQEIPKSQTKFKFWLDQETNNLVKKAKLSWGLARKVLNLFLRDAVYNRYLYDKFKLKDIEKWLEIPLDKIVARALRKKNKSLPSWPGLKIGQDKQNINIYEKYQEFAQALANEKGIARVHLDLYLWLENRKDT